MIKKNWDKPELFNLGIEETQGGGQTITVHDGVIYQQPNGNYVEEYRS